MGVLRFSINTTLDGCCDHEAVTPDESLHRHLTETIGRADALLFGRVIYGMMEEAWRLPASGELPEWMEPWMVPFARAIDAKPKYVVSSTLESVDWNAQLVEGDLAEAVRALKSEYDSLYTGGVTLPLALAELDLIDEYEFVIHPRLVGRGPTPFAGLTADIDLVPTTRFDLACGAVVTRYRFSGEGSVL